jgi:uncharacterized protein
MADVHSDTRRPLALLTGASRGIGLELARLLAADGHDLILVARSTSDLETLAESLRQQHHVTIRTHRADLSEPDAAKQLWRELGDEVTASLDILVNNAGIGLQGDLWTQDLDALERLITLNVTTTVTLTRLAAASMVGRRRGRILNVASVASYQPGGPRESAYYASKAFVLSFCKGVQQELRGTGVTLTALCPGPTRTAFDTAAGASTTPLYSVMPATSAIAVARSAYRGLMRGKPIVIPGLFAKVMAIAGELPPRRIALEVNRRLLR